MNEKKAGRPPLKDESKKRDQKVMLTFTKDEYEELKRMQVLLNRSTLTSTVQLFINRGMESLKNEIVRGR
jgi:hypothetical protein